MELKKVKEDDKTLLVEVKGETYTITNAVRDYLWDDKSVSEAAQIKEHPYLSQPKIFVKTTKGAPVAALEKATDKILEDAREFKQKFKDALKK